MHSDNGTQPTLPQPITAAPYVVLPVSEAGTATGALVWWQLSGTLRAEALEAAWAAAGLNPEALPRAPQAEIVRRRAFRRQLRVGLRAQESEAVRAASAALVESERGASPAGDIPVELRTELRPSDARPEYDVLTHTEVSAWLVKRVAAADAVGLREGGGLYFVPRAKLDGFRRECAALRAASGHTVHACPAAHSEDVVGAVLSGLRAEATELYGRIERDLTENEVGTRAIESRRCAIVALRAKLGRYEALLGEALPDITERAGLLDAALVQAALAKMAAATEAT